MHQILLKIYWESQNNMIREDELEEVLRKTPTEEVVVLMFDGHGAIIDKDLEANSNHRIIFPVHAKSSMSIQHGFLIMQLMVNPPINIANSLHLLENLKTTEVVQLDSTSFDSNLKEHFLKTALTSFPEEYLLPSKITINRFLHYPEVEYIFDLLRDDLEYINLQKWLNINPFILEIDRIALEKEVRNFHCNPANEGRKLSPITKSNIIYLHPTSENIIRFSYIIDEILPKLRILTVYHYDDSVDILTAIFDYRNDLKLNEMEAKEDFEELFDDYRDSYVEFCVPTNVKIVWNCCRNDYYKYSEKFTQTENENTLFDDDLVSPEALSGISMAGESGLEYNEPSADY